MRPATLAKLNMMKAGQPLSGLAPDRVNLYANNIQKLFLRRVAVKK